MTIDMIITLAVVIFMVALIISDKLPFGAPPMIACALLVVLNQATIAEAYSGFVDSNVIMICGCLLVYFGSKYCWTSYDESLKEGGMDK